MSETDLIRDLEADERIRDAAHDILEELKRSTIMLERRIETAFNVRRQLERNRAAIAKAEGRP
jgi:hypothetical protein